MGYEITCNSGGANTRLPKCKGDYGRVLFHILVPPDFEIADQSTAETQSTWQDLIEDTLSDRGYPLPKYFMYSPSREDHLYEQGHYGDKISIKEGDPDGIAMYENLPICFAKKLRQFNGQEWKAYAVTEEGFILGKSSDGTKFEPMSVFFFCEPDKPATSEESRKTPIRIYETDSREWMDYGVVIQPTALSSSAWNPADLEGLLDVNVTIVSSSSTEVVCDVKSTCDLTPVTSLVLADFLLKDDADGSETINSVTESTSVDGRYTLDVSTLGADGYVLNLKPPASMTTEGYAGGDDATFTVT